MIIALENLKAAVARIRTRKKYFRLVVTNGCFDLIHPGHVAYLEQCRSYGDFLLVGLNGDRSVSALKGPSRPVMDKNSRATVLESIRWVDAVCIFEQKRATRFLDLARPDVYAKGGDYSFERLDRNERNVLLKHRTQIVFVPFVAGHSTTALIKRLDAGSKS